jgi:hypothetical protein
LELEPEAAWAQWIATRPQGRFNGKQGTVEVSSKGLESPAYGEQDD